MRLGPLLAGKRQYVVPYFQRMYSWRRHQWNTLFDDILELYELGSSNSHFLGSMVLLAENNAEAVAPTLLIDGQQRLVTLSLFLAAIRDAARESRPDFAEHLHTTYLVNDGLPQTEDAHLKVLATHQDRAAFATVIDRAAEPPQSPIRDAYRTFREALAEHTDRGLDLDRLVRIVISQLSFVAITLDAQDNPYRIFESLNAKGMPLTQGDLLRNYFFMRLPSEEHDEWFRSIWQPMQSQLGDALDDFMHDYLAKDGEDVREEEVYQAWRKRLAPLDVDGVKGVLRDLALWAAEYDRTLHPGREQDAELRRRLEWLSAWSAT